MSYCRFGNADAYIFDHANFGIVCMACLLMPATGENDPFPDTFVAGYDYEKMLDHIKEHRDNGHHIPLDVDERLKEEMTCTHTDLDKRCGECWRKETLPMTGHFPECNWDGSVVNRSLCQCYYPNMDKEYGD